jgi:hypothetical protein
MRRVSALNAAEAVVGRGAGRGRVIPSIPSISISIPHCHHYNGHRAIASLVGTTSRICGTRFTFNRNSNNSMIISDDSSITGHGKRSIHHHHHHDGVSSHDEQISSKSGNNSNNNSSSSSRQQSRRQVGVATGLAMTATIMMGVLGGSVMAESDSTPNVPATAEARMYSSRQLALFRPDVYIGSYISLVTSPTTIVVVDCLWISVIDDAYVHLY